MKPPSDLVSLYFTQEHEELIKKRQDFAAAYCAEHGWNPDALNFRQILEIRRQDGWKTPSTGSTDHA